MKPPKHLLRNRHSISRRLDYGVGVGTPLGGGGQALDCARPSASASAEVWFLPREDAPAHPDTDGRFPASPLVLVWVVCGDVWRGGGWNCVRKFVLGYCVAL